MAALTDQIFGLSRKRERTSSDAKHEGDTVNPSWIWEYKYIEQRYVDHDVPWRRLHWFTERRMCHSSSMHAFIQTSFIFSNSPVLFQTPNSLMYCSAPTSLAPDPSLPSYSPFINIPAYMYPLRAIVFPRSYLLLPAFIIGLLPGARSFCFFSLVLLTPPVAYPSCLNFVFCLCVSYPVLSWEASGYFSCIDRAGKSLLLKL